MCLARVYLREDSGEELVLEDVAHMEVIGHELVLQTLFGERKELAASIKEIDFTHSRITLEALH